MITESVIWLMLSTFCRMELSKARWEHIDFEAKTWFIPDEHSKNGKPHTAYLSDFALGYCRRLHDYRLCDVWVFPARNNAGHVCEKSMSKQVMDRQTTRELSNHSRNKDALLLSGGNLAPSHALRRTGATLMGDLGVLPDVIEKCLNPVERNKMKRVYQRQELRVEQVDAWKRLGERLELLTRVNKGNIMIMKQENWFDYPNSTHPGQSRF
jgi:integrase